MATIAVGAPPAAPAPEAQPRTSWFSERGPAQFIAAIGAVLGVWIVLFILLRGRNTLALAPADTKPLHVWLSDLQTRVGEGRNTNPLFTLLLQSDPVGDRRVRHRDRRPDRAPGRRATRPLHRLARCRGAVHLPGLGARQLEGRAAHPVRLVVHGPAGPVAGEHGDAGADHRGGRDSAAHRNPAGHLGRAYRTGSIASSPRCWISCRSCRRSSTSPR